MPRISAFHGITIRMFFDERIHSGRPHFHAEYAGAAASFEIGSLDRLAGVLPPRVEQLVRQWAHSHEEELMVNWNHAREHERLNSISPLS